MSGNTIRIIQITTKIRRGRLKKQKQNGRRSWKLEWKNKTQIRTGNKLKAWWDGWKRVSLGSTQSAHQSVRLSTQSEDAEKEKWKEQTKNDNNERKKNENVKGVLCSPEPVGQNTLPITVCVNFPGYQGPASNSQEPKVVPVPAIMRWMEDDQFHSQTQDPLSADPHIRCHDAQILGLDTTRRLGRYRCLRICARAYLRSIRICAPALATACSRGSFWTLPI